MPKQQERQWMLRVVGKHESPVCASLESIGESFKGGAKHMYRGRDMRSLTLMKGVCSGRARLQY